MSEVKSLSNLQAAVARKSYISVIRSLKEGAAKDQPGVMMSVAAAGQLDILNLLLRQGWDPATPGALNDRCGTWITSNALHQAVDKGHKKCVRNLLDTGMDVDLRDGCQRTPLHLAADRGHAWAVKALLARQAAVNVVQDKKLVLVSSLGGDDNDGWMPLHLAAATEKKAHVVKLLLDAGAVVDARTAQRETPLHIACRNQNLAAVQELCARGAQVNAVNGRGYTPLHLAIHHSQLDMVDLLLCKNARVDTVNMYGICPWREALYRHQEFANWELILCLLFERRLASTQVLKQAAGMAASFKSQWLAQRVRHLATNPPTLTELSCVAVRSRLSSLQEDVTHLSLPYILQDIISFKSSLT